MTPCRRRVLGYVSGLTFLAGCQAPGTPGGPEEPTRTNTEEPTPTPKGTPSPRLSAELRFEGSVLEPFSRTSPARLELSVENRSERTITTTDSLPPVTPFAGRFGTNQDATSRLYLYPDSAEEYWLHVEDSTLVPVADVLPSEPENGCWRIPETVDGIAIPPGLHSRDIPPESTQSQRYSLYHLHDCVHGTYTFSQSVTLSAPDVEPESAVPLLVIVDIEEGGDVDLRFVGIHSGYHDG